MTPRPSLPRCKCRERRKRRLGNNKRPLVAMCFTLEEADPPARTIKVWVYGNKENGLHDDAAATLLLLCGLRWWFGQADRIFGGHRRYGGCHLGLMGTRRCTRELRALRDRRSEFEFSLLVARGLCGRVEGFHGGLVRAGERPCLVLLRFFEIDRRQTRGRSLFGKFFRVEQPEFLVVHGAYTTLVLPLLLLYALGVCGDYLLVRWKSRIWLVHGSYPGSFAFWSVACGRSGYRPSTRPRTLYG